MPPSGEVVSDLEEEEEEGALGAAQEYRAFKSGRTPYREEERREIVAAVVARRAHGRVRGNALWKVLEEEKLCRGNRTWQSMKEQYRKVGRLLSKCTRFYYIVTKGQSDQKTLIRGNPLK